MSSGDGIKVDVFFAAENRYIQFTICAAGVELYQQYKWWAVKIQNTINGQINYRMRCAEGSFHNKLIKAKHPLVADHKNQISTDNRLCNLRLATISQNSANRRKTTKQCSSKFKGVSKQKNRKLEWRAQIKINGKKINLGDFSTETKAAHAYDKAALEFFGEFAGLNFAKEKK